ncbi:MAG: PD-(D/E)XK nuclease family protein [Clostridia bacterium]|nr:PD-(D/E)XK nuclease family protein [Clostridia bacterium]
MPLQFILGRSGSGKSEYIIKKASSLESENKRVLMIVPEQYSHQGETAFLKEKGYIHDGYNVTSFARLSKKILTENGNKKISLDSAAKAMLTLRAVVRAKERLSFFRSANENQGYISLFTDAISEFKKGCVTPSALSAAAAATPDRLMSMRLFDLAQILTEYDLFTPDGFCDSDDNLTLAAMVCAEKSLFRDTTVFIDEFYRFTQNEIVFLGALLKSGANVCIALSIPENESYGLVFDSLDNTKKTLLALCEKLGANVLPSIVLKGNKRAKTDALLHLEAQMAGSIDAERESFVKIDNKINSRDKNKEDVSLYVARNPYEEVTYAAAKIRRYLKTSGASLNEIAVIAGNYDSYADIVSSVFPTYDLPVFVDTRRDFLSHPIVLYVFTIFDLLSQITTKCVISYIKSGFAPISDDEAFRLENYVLSAAIEYGDWADDERFLKKASRGIFEKEDENFDNAEEILTLKHRVLDPVFSLKEDFSKSKEANERISALFRFFDATALEDKLTEKIENFRNKNMLRLSDEYASVFEILKDTFLSMSRILGTENIGVNAMRSVLEAGLNKKSIGVVPKNTDAISFGDLNRSVIKNVRALFVLGANEGAFPQDSAESQLLSDDEREFLHTMGIFVSPTSKKRILQGEFSVYNGVNIAKEKLFVSYPVSDEGGAGKRPAAFISQLKKIFPSLAVESDLTNAELSFENRVASLDSAYSYLLTHLENLENDENAKTIYELLSENDKYKEKVKTAKEFLNFKNTAGKLDKDTVELLYGKSLYGSVSRFERFSACPFSFFVEYGLKAKERKVLKVEAPDIGSLLHEVVELFSKEMAEKNKPLKDATESEIKEITHRITSTLLDNAFIKNVYGKGRLTALSNRLESLVLRSVSAICLHAKMGEFEPFMFEASFDFGGDLPPVKVELPDGSEIVMRGRIDRIDAFRKDGKVYLKVIDYKSGSKGYSLSDIFNKTTLQLAVYSAAAQDGLKGENALFGGMFYFHLDDPITDGGPQEDLQKKIDIELKTFKMSGLAPDDPEIIRAIDKGVSGYSAVIPVYLKADGTLSKNLSKTASEDDFENLKAYVNRALSEIGQDILSGKVDISPLRNGKNLPCDYCKYSSVCGFDPDVHKVRRVKCFDSDEEIWEEIKEEIK